MYFNQSVSVCMYHIKLNELSHAELHQDSQPIVFLVSLTSRAIQDFLHLLLAVLI
jgi:hypothetical protein